MHLSDFLSRPRAPQDHGFNVLNRLLAFDPRKRLTAKAALEHPWFEEVPLPCEKALMPTYPKKQTSELARDNRKARGRDGLRAAVRVAMAAVLFALCARAEAELVLRLRSFLLPHTGQVAGSGHCIQRLDAPREPEARALNQHVGPTCDRFRFLQC